LRNNYCLGNVYQNNNKMKTESDNNNGDETWGRTDNEAYVWENEGQQEHHDHVENGKDHRKTDSTIQEDISKILTSDNLLDATNILVEVSKGGVRLSGNVSQQNEKERAEDLVRAVPGVLNVQNLIWVGTGDNKPSSEHHYKTLLHSQSSSPKSIF
jgi:osmotically-inducible protein OsmY